MVSVRPSPSQWEALEQDLAEALCASEAPRICPRKSALGFPDRLAHAPLSRSLSADPAPGLLGSASVTAVRELLCRVTWQVAVEDRRHMGCAGHSSCADGFEENVACDADEEAPLASPVAGRTRPSSRGQMSPWRSGQLEGSPSRRDMLGWQLPGPRSRAAPTCRMQTGDNAHSEAALPDFPPSATSSTAGVVRLSDSASGVDSNSMQRVPSVSSPPIPGLGLPEANASPIMRARAHSAASPLERSSAGGVRSWMVAAEAAKLERLTVTAPFQMPTRSAVQKEAIECAICMDHFLPGELIRTLPCCHRFHACCVDPWLTSRWQCPLCKHEVC